MKRLTLRHRLILLCLLPSSVIALTLVVYFTLSGIGSLENELRRQGVATVRYLAPISEYGIITGQLGTLQTLVQTAVEQPAVKAALITNHKGQAIVVSGRVRLGSEILHTMHHEPGIVAESSDWVAFAAPVMRSVERDDILFGTHAKSSTDDNLKPVFIGQVFIELDKTELISQQRQLMWHGFLIMFVGILVLSVLAIAVANALVKPLVMLVNAVKNMSAGKFDTRVSKTSSAEIGVLEQGFNDMAENIEHTHQTMQSRIEEATAELAHQATHDTLTGLVNRREFERRLSRILIDIQSGADESSVLFIDLDRFKPVNDVCGHLAGDELLRQISQLFLSRTRSEDTLARLGGDEFGIILADCNESRAQQVAESICILTEAFRFIWRDKIFNIGASIGLTTVNRNTQNVAEILQASDAACYRAKELGRNQVQLGQQTGNEDRRQQTNSWPHRIANALANNRLHIESLPLKALQFDADKMGYQVKVTARLSEPGQPSVAYAALIDAAERCDMALRIDLHLLEKSLLALHSAHLYGKSLHCIVPLSSVAIGSSEVIKFIEMQLNKLGIPGKGLCLMIPEDVSSQHRQKVAGFAKRISDFGCTIGFDSFSGSLTSFSLLRDISPCCIRLSSSLMPNEEGTRASTALLRAIQEISSDQNVHTIVCDVDNLHLLEVLRALGISYAQGKAVAPAEPFEVWLQGEVFRSVRVLETDS